MSPKYASKNGLLLQRNPKLQQMGFEDYFHRYKNNVNLKPQVSFTSHLLSENPIDFVGRFEYMSDDFNKVLPKLETKTRLPYENAARQKVNYRDFFTSEFKNEVGDFYAADIKKFNYSF